MGHKEHNVLGVVEEVIGIKPSSKPIVVGVHHLCTSEDQEVLLEAREALIPYRNKKIDCERNDFIHSDEEYLYMFRGRDFS